MSERWLVCGSGLGGVVAAYALAREGRAVTLVDRAAHVGGVNTAVAWGDYFLDFGCHLFGNDEDETTAVILDLIDGEVSGVELTFASMFNGVKTPEFELPALDVFGPETQGRALLDLLDAVARPATAAPRSLAEALTQRFGETASGLLGLAVQKQFGVGPDALAPAAAAATASRRIKLVDDDTGRVLKQIAALDERIAIRGVKSRADFYRASDRALAHRAFYPSEHGMAGFSEGAERRLKALGVELALGDGVASMSAGSEHVEVALKSGRMLTGDRVFWAAGLSALQSALGLDASLAASVQSVPMVLFYFAIDEARLGEHCYVTSYDADELTFRATVPSRFGSTNAPPGRAYLCSEVPTEIDSPVWQDPARFRDQVWREAVRFGVVTEGEALDFTTKRTPVSYRAPRVEFEGLAAPLKARIDAEPRVDYMDEWAFTKSATVRAVLRQVQAALDA